MSAPQTSATTPSVAVPVWLSETAMLGMGSGMMLGAILLNSWTAILIGAPVGFAFGVWAESHTRKKRLRG